MLTMAVIKLISGLALALATSLATYHTTEVWIRISKERGLNSRDLHKPYNTEAAKMGGLPASIAVTITPSITALLFGVDLASLQLAAIFYASMGLIDDILGLRNLEKIVLAGIPFLLLNHSLMPFYPFNFLESLHLIAIVLFGIYVTNAFNTLAGFNGLEAGSSLIVSVTLALLLLARGDVPAFITMVMVSAILASFLTFNWLPARAFPGNVMTFLLGGYIAYFAALKGLYWPLVILTIPHGLDFFLKIVSWRKTEKKIPTRVREDGTLIPPPNKSLAWLLIKIGVNKEGKLVKTVLGMELTLAFLTLLIYLPR
ncbi:MAG TPA: hypothetical protein ENF57_00550 [Candidatus Korarchaeota archaeon]|nr:hypothetical protein [Candidatus Korarchaeota archaeon]